MFKQRLRGVNLKTDDDARIGSWWGPLWHTRRELHFVAERGKSVMRREIWAAVVGMFVAAMFASAAGAQQCTVKPASISLGQTVRLRCEVEVATAQLDFPARGGAAGTAAKVAGAAGSESSEDKSRTVRLFKQASGGWEGLMPVAVKDAPGGYDVKFLATGGAEVASARVTIQKTIFPKQNVTLAPSIEALHSTSDEMQTLTTFRDAVSDVKYWHEPFVAPLPGCVISPFGVARLHNGKPTGEFHAGIDQRGALGTPIHAIAGGVVKIVQPFNVLGGTVAIDHGQGLETMYLHMSKLNVAVGDHVARGDTIGYVGATGRANGPHLHWVVYVNGVPQNPQQWVAGLEPCTAAKAKPTSKK
jgi:murein DD-endopeptidase MepM/ murein hydrolase activator NlpD